VFIISFKLPVWGGGMVHSDPQMTDFINLEIPKEKVVIIRPDDNLESEKRGAKGNGIAGNGRYAACTFHGFKDNLIIYDYYIKRLWTSGNALNAVAVSSTPLVGWDSKGNDCVICCDNKKMLMVKLVDNEWKIIWETVFNKEKSGLIIPFSPTIVKEKIIILPTRNGPVYGFDVDNGTILFELKLGAYGNNKCFSTINSACVNNNRVFITTQGKNHSRLYAIDVDVKNKKASEVWYFPFCGTNQASPLFIDKNVYFDGYYSRIFGKSFIYSLSDMKNSYTIKSEPIPKNITVFPHRTLFSFSMDPRGGFGIMIQGETN